ncbi:hypothetical protein CA13_47650 [Planctomycetes bacterium CA13]|uniref:Thioredoxin domain-containing protein n=1 Tax=Novipirellula herctigrandis TaxID=2527986 RepID=A0A5C5Z7X8_9BACT|nr:hypothetical protein CA13_47650 [Planctomycetes bacterium CA13]
MKAKNFLTIGLLLFVVAAIATVLLKESAKETPTDISVKEVTAEAIPENGLVATFFHGEVRCPTCRTIEQYAHEAIEEGFPEQFAAGEIQWRTMNYETPSNQHFAEDYEIYSSTVVLVRTLDGKPEQWRNLEEVWNHVNDKESFSEYVQSEAKEMLASQ